jgi:hypothetical protein
LDVLYGGLGISKLQFLIKKDTRKKIQLYVFKFLVIKTLDPDPYPVSLENLDLAPSPDPDSINPDSQHWFFLHTISFHIFQYFVVLFSFSILGNWHLYTVMLGVLFVINHTIFSFRQGVHGRENGQSVYSESPASDSGVYRIPMPG